MRGITALERGRAKTAARCSSGAQVESQETISAAGEQEATTQWGD